MWVMGVKKFLGGSCGGLWNSGGGDGALWGVWPSSGGGGWVGSYEPFYASDSGSDIKYRGKCKTPDQPTLHVLHAGYQ